MPAKPHTQYLFYRLGYTSRAFSLLSGVAGILGRKMSKIIGEICGNFYATLHRDVVQVITSNLKMLKGQSVAECDGARVLKNFSITMADYLWLGTRPRNEALKFAQFEGESINPNLVKNGAILATGHYGFFEYGALVLGQAGYPMSVITHPEPTSALTQWRANYRRRWGAETIELAQDAFSSLRAVDAIRKGHLTAMLVDRPLGGRAINIKLKGGSAPFSISPAILSWITGCAIIPVTVRRLPSGEYVIRSNPPIYADRKQSRDAAISSCTQLMAETLIADFQCDPLQWYHFVPLDSSQ